MFRIRMTASAAALAAAMTATLPGARAQTAYEAIEYTFEDPVRATDPAIGVSEDRILLTTNEWFSLRHKNANLITTVGRDMTDPLPFTLADPTSERLFDPRAAYDPVSERLWIVMGESKISGSFPGEWDNSGHIHLAVSKNSSPDDFTSADWHFYTASNAYDLQDPTFEALGVAFEGLSERPRLAFDTDNIYVSATDYEILPPGVIRFSVIVIPRTHDGGSILDGDRPDESDITIIQPASLGVPDTSYLHEPVWETAGDDAPGVQFFIATELSPLTSGIEQTKLRLAGVYPDAGTWQYQHKLLDLVTMTSDDRFYNNDHDPATPDATWSPSERRALFESAVMWTDPNGVRRIFATHSVRVDDTAGSPQTVRWYVIDPDVDNFPGMSWDPEVLTVGDIASEDNEEGYHPAIAVNPIGETLITFTMSSPNDWPQLWHAWLSSDFTSVDSMSLTKLGPSLPLSFASAWGDFADLQADPSNCQFWSHDTLVHDPGGSATESDTRQTWLVHYNANCGGNGDFNGDSVVDAQDLAEFIQAYDAKAPKADLDRNEKVTSVDSLIFMDAWSRGIR